MTYAKWLRSNLISLKKSNNQFTSSFVHDTLTRLLYEGDVNTVNITDKENPYYLTASIVAYDDLDPSGITSGWPAYPQDLPPDWDINISINGIHLPLLTRDQALNYDGSVGIPIHYRLFGELDIQGIDLARDPESDPVLFSFPENLNATAWVSKGDILKARVADVYGNDNPERFNPTWEIFRWDAASQDWTLVERRIDVDTFQFDQTYIAGIPYRVIYSVRDAYGFTEQMVQDFGFVRDLSNITATFQLSLRNVSADERKFMRVKLRESSNFTTQLFGGENSEGFKISVTDLEQDIYNENGIEKTVPYPGLDLRFTVRNHLPESGRTFTRYNQTGWQFTSYNWIGECDYMRVSQTETPRPEPDLAPFPVEMWNFVVTDTWTGREHAFDVANTLSVTYDGLFECETNDPLPSSTIIPVTKEEPWYYSDDQVADFVIETEAILNHTTYQANPANFTLQVVIEPELNTDETQILVNTPLHAYLAATGQSFETFDVNLNHIATGRLRIQFNAIEPKPGNTQEVPTQWRDTFVTAKMLNPNTKDTITRRFRFYIVNSTSNEVLTSSDNYRGDGFPITLSYGSPPETLGISQLSFRSVNKERVLFRDDVNETATFIQEVTPNSDLNVAMVNWENFYWKWENEGEAWDGQAWVPSAQTAGVQIGAANGSLAQSTVTYDSAGKLIRIYGRIPINTLGEAFWAKGNAIPVALSLSYRGRNGTVISPENTAERQRYTTQFTLYRNDSTLIDAPQNLSSGLGVNHGSALETLASVAPGSDLGQALAAAYAPEPFTLASENVQDQAQHTWVLGKEALAINDLATTPNLNSLGSYAYLTIPFTPNQNQNERHLVFLVPYPEATASAMPFTYANRQATTLNAAQTTWQQQYNVFWRNQPGDNLNPAQFQIVVFIPENELVRSPLAPVDRTFLQNNVELQMPNSDASNFGQSTDHNRIVTITYPDREDPSHRIVTVLFSDLTGRAQETRTMATKVSAEMRNKVVISGVTEFDSLGRQTKTGKTFLADIGQNPYIGNGSLQNAAATMPLELAAAGSRTDTFAAGTRFWHTGNARPGGPDNLSYIVQKDSAPVVETLYEQDPTRARVLGTIPMGEQARSQTDPLRFERYHFFTISAQQSGSALPTQRDLLIENLETGNNLLPLDEGGATAQPGLKGSLAIDPNGLMSMTLVGQEDRKLFDIVNPEVSMLTDWGFDVRVGEHPARIENHVIYLPSDYADRLGTVANPGQAAASGNWPNDRNLVTFHQFDRKGRMVATWPPRALSLRKSAGGPWAIAPTASGANLTTRFEYDAHDRMIATHEPDAGTSWFVYDRHGRVRLHQQGNTAGGTLWRETIYDPEGRVVALQTLDLSAFPGGATRASLQNTLNPNQSGALAPADFGPLANTGEPINDSFVETLYDVYDTFNRRQPFVRHTETGPSASNNAFWPNFFDLQAAYPWDEDGILFADPIGQIVETNSAHSAERVYYDFKGRAVCRVYLVRGVLEPQITWLQYDNRDLVTAFYNQTHHQGLGFQYDAFGRLVHTLDLTPLSDRMQIAVTHRQVGAEFTTPVASAHAVLGPLIDETANISMDETQRTLTTWTYTPTGHIDEVTYGDGAGVQVGNRYRYDVRDWLYTHDVRVGNLQTYQVELDYFGLNDCFTGDCGQNGNPLNEGVRRMFDGTIAILNETYHHTTEVEALGSGSDSIIRPQVLRHEFGYDGIYQLTHAHHSWPQPYSQTYQYDRNGNRIREIQNNKPSFDSNPPISTTLNHSINGNNNQLTYLSSTNGGYGWDQMAFGYDNLGNVTTLEHFNFTGGLQNTFRQDMVYNDQRFPQLPTQINQSKQNETAADELDAHNRTFRYDHNGARVFRQIGAGATAKTTFFVPAGNDNAVELDAWGRAKRYYLFNGEERFGYKSKYNTGLYVKDHLGSTKMVLAANRNLPAPDLTQTPPPTATPGLEAAQPLVAMAFEGNLTNEGLLADGSAVGTERYMSRDGRRALWLEQGDRITLANDTRLERLSQAFSLVLWVYDADERDGVEDYASMICVGTQRSIRYNTINFYLASSKQPVLLVGGGAEGWQYLSQWPLLPHRTWTQLAVTFDGRLVRFYQNGEEVGEPQEVTLPALYPAQDIALGDWPTYDGYRMHGSLDQVEIHDRVLGLEEIRAHYNNAFILHDPMAGTQEAVAQPSAYNQIRELMVMRLGDTDPYGNTLREEYPSDTPEDGKEPHQFTGQEREHGTGLTYMGGRWYHPAAGRFVQTDPAREFVNPYSYAANNPQKYTDPTGETLFFHKNVPPAERAFFLSELQKISNHKLALKNDQIIIEKCAQNVTKPQGTLLSERVIESPHKTIILRDPNKTELKRPKPGKVKKGKVENRKIFYWAPNKTPGTLDATADGKTALSEYTPMFVILAHELIHADRDNRGVFYPPEKTTTNTVNLQSIKKPYDILTRIEELATIGIKNHNKEGDITENEIRKENGLLDRKAH
ncbi:RHS repeat-associated core domain-containing protein [Acanthopleuribacter pedis]|uniref:Uncharacterized protein n=1 Tax=Acanthopleuribacter pedis TaxID=442870 RepID=A0A8J7Q9E3_9BACT|nr:LamG-like jellyroll fold domain-containing protein [Acanthopleuribacter pedis]MBO1321061.1 hypothetical protein [Acanthopleuribacter pedis]